MTYTEYGERRFYIYKCVCVDIVCQAYV
jgi:hypothetical protein